MLDLLMSQGRTADRSASCRLARPARSRVGLSRSLAKVVRGWLWPRWGRRLWGQSAISRGNPNKKQGTLSAERGWVLTQGALHDGGRMDRSGANCSMHHSFREGVGRQSTSAGRSRTGMYVMPRLYSQNSYATCALTCMFFLLSCCLRAVL